ncbi:hypothetical protein BACCAP_00167 [Pseudoflavonifractor capillosus ATCC 29799]|uniref:Uncharacterized protein n=1 Tax=Pseudoflavonifractor capillosus ATCC 29799 TaxID=411467 RepID=A6NPQ2_9FIRM|nr:hypothetical protein BACCAP_00167 [Pseudoflavonifractor capillosus ATCC 29799]
MISSSGCMACSSRSILYWMNFYYTTAVRTAQVRTAVVFS